MYNFQSALCYVPLETLSSQRKDQELVVCRAGRASDRKLIQSLQQELSALKRPLKAKAPARDYSARVQNTPTAIRQAKYRERSTEVPATNRS